MEGQKPDSKNSNPLGFARGATRQLRMIVEIHQKNSTPERFESFLASVRKVFDQYYAALSGFDPGIDRALMAQKLVNQSIQGSSETAQATCAKGCGACCHLEVEVTTDEGQLLSGLVKEGVAVDSQQLADQAARKRGSSEWAKILQPSNRCVFLDEQQACRIYDFRPMSCRKHMVSSPPQACTQGTEQPIRLPFAEIAISAALSQPGNTATSLAKALNAALGNKKKKKKGSKPPSGKKKLDLPPPVEL